VLGGENLTLAQLLEVVGEVTGRRYTVLAVPLPMDRAVAGVCELSGLLGVEPMITRAWVDLLAQDRPASCEGAQRELGYRPRTARAGIAETVEWLDAGCPAPSAWLSPAQQAT
jgi:dihydroflavonol-4-reductase